MGALLEMPAGAWPWSAEVRSESTYLYAVGLADGFPAVRSGAGVGEVAVTLPRDALMPLAVACSVVLAHPSMARRQRADESWRVVPVGRAFVVLRGAGLVYFTEERVRVAGMASTLEVGHGHLASLRAAALERVPAS